MAVSGAWATTTVTVHKTDKQANNSSNYGTWNSAKTTYTTTSVSGLTGLTVDVSNGTWDRATVSSSYMINIKSTVTDGSPIKLTITAPFGYVVTGYSLSAYSWNSAKSWSIVSEDSSPEAVTVSTETSSTSTVTYTESDLYAFSTTLNITGGDTSTSGYYIAFTNFTVTVESISAYTVNIKNYDESVRGYVCDNTGGTALTATVNSAASANKEYLIVPYNNKYFLYSVNQNKFASSANQTFAANVVTTLAATPTNALTITPSYYSSTSTFKMSWDSNTSYYLNISDSELKLIASSNDDEGTNFTLVKANDATTALSNANSLLSTYVSSPTIDADEEYALKVNNTTHYLSSNSSSVITSDDSGTNKALLKFATNGTNTVGKQIYSIQNVSTGQYLAYTNANKSSSGTDTRLSWADASTNSQFVITQGTGDYSSAVLIRPAVATESNYFTDWNNTKTAQNIIFWTLSDAMSYWVLETPETVDVTYSLPETDMESVTITQASGTAPLVPTAWARDGVTYSYYSSYSEGEFSDEVSTVTSTQTVYVDYTYSYSSMVSASASDLSWYRFATYSNSAYYDLYYNASAPYPHLAQSAFDGSDGYFWAIVGNPFDGFQIYNKALGNTYQLDYNNDTYPAMAEGSSTKWYVVLSSSNLGFVYTGNSSKKLNDLNGGANYLKYYGSPSYYQLTSIDGVDFSVLVTYNIQPYITAAGDGYFKISEDDASTLSSEITTANNDESITISEYQTLLSSLRDKINYPASGYYRIKNVSKETYLKAESTSQLTVGGTATDVSSIVYLTGSNGSYTVQMQGMYAHSNSNDAACYLNETEATLGFTAPVESNYIIPGKVIIGQGASATDYFRANGDNVNGVVLGSNPNGDSNCYWIVEAATSATVAMHQVGEYYYATLCVPFQVSGITGASAYTVTSVSSTEATVSEAATSIAAGTPVFLQGTAASATLTIGSGYATTPVTTTKLTGTFVDLGVTAETDYFLGTDGDRVGFFKWDGTTLKANRSYLTASTVNGTSAKGFVLNFDNMETAIKSLNEEVVSKTFYDLSGRRVQNPTKGIFIVDGKKVVIK